MNGSSIAAWWSAWAPRLLSVLRIFTAFIFIQAGTMKLFAFPMGMPPNGATATPFSEFWIAGVLEVVGGVFLLLGLFARPWAFLLSGEMAVAYFQFSAPLGFWPIANNGVTPALCCFVWLYLGRDGALSWLTIAYTSSVKRVRRLSVDGCGGSSH